MGAQNSVEKNERMGRIDQSLQPHLPKLPPKKALISVSRMSGKLSRRDWIDAALETLLEEGINGVKIMQLSRKLGTSRGSFYWHFGSRAELLQAILEDWKEKSTEPVVDYISALDLGPTERIFELMRFVMETERVKYDLAIRAWALYDANALAVVRGTDKRRLGYIDNLFREAGFDADQAASRTRLLANYLIWDPSLGIQESKAKKTKRLVLRHKILIS
jgi:AcrR family transcriptional regulator